MISGLRARASYANVVATICLFVVLGGGAYALQRQGSSGNTHGLHVYRIRAQLNEGASQKVLWHHRAFRLTGSCFVNGSDTFTETSAAIGSPRAGVDYSSIVSRIGTPGSDHTVYANEGADPGDQGFVAAVTATGTSPLPADGNFGATLPATGSGHEQTVTGNIIVLARHHAVGKDCSINGEITFG